MRAITSEQIRDAALAADEAVQEAMSRIKSEADKESCQFSVEYGDMVHLKMKEVYAATFLGILGIPEGEISLEKVKELILAEQSPSF